MKLFRKITSVILALTAAVGLCGCSGNNSGNIGDIVLNAGDLIAEINIEGYGVIKAKLFPDIAPVGVENFTKLAESGYYNGLKIHRVVKDCCIQGGSLNGDGSGGRPAVNNGNLLNTETSLNARNYYGALGYANLSGDIGTQFYIVNCKKTQDLGGYDPAKMKAKADEFTAQAAELEEGDSKKAVLEAQANTYNNMAGMFEKATEEVVAKYAETGGYPFWDGVYTVFGQVFEGMDVVEKITASELTTSNTGEISRPVEDIIISSVTITKYVPPEPEPESSKKKKK